LKYYGRVVTLERTDTDRLCKLICARSTVSPADVKAVIESLAWVLDFELSAGHSVKLGEVGSFRMSLASEGTEEEQDFTAHNILKARIIFTPSNRLRKTTREAKFEPYLKPDVVEIEVEKECNLPHA
jgi:predicted histone-like DNA-binding protein